MASGDKLIELFTCFKENNQVEFSKVAYEIIEEEKKKNHYLLANKLENVLFDKNRNFTIKSSKNNIYNKELPKDKDTGFPLVEMKFPKKDLEDIIITEENKYKVNRVLNEFENRELLETYKLSPKTKILFCGPPGCGKTITAEAISNELAIPMLYTRFDSLISSYLGETATNLRKIFDFSKDGEWVLFFDEFDSIGKSRDIDSENSELKRVVNSFLQLVDNYPKDKIIIAATNYEKLIDKALWRRFDEIIFFGLPNENEIEVLINKLLRCFSKKTLDVKKFSKKLIGFSFCDIERLCHNTIKSMILQGEEEVTNELFEINLNQEINRQKLIEDSLK